MISFKNNKAAIDVPIVKHTSFFTRFWAQRYLQLMIIPVIIWLIIFCYTPMFGLQIAFKNFMFNKGIVFSPWVGLKQFQAFFIDPQIIDVIRNTMCMSLIKVVFMFPLPILLAISLNEVSHLFFKKIIQTVSYFPYFISWSIVALMATTWLSTSNGFVNDFLVGVGILSKPYLFLGDPNAFWWIALGLEMWKMTGWGSIIYIAAIAGVDQQMYEASYIDGANRLQRIWHITLPAIKGTIMIMMIMNIGNMLYGGLYATNFQESYLLGNDLIQSKSEILDTYVLKIGIGLARYSYATAVGLLTSLVSVVLLLTANFVSKKVTDESFL